MSKQRLDPLSEQTIDWMVKLRAGTPDSALQERFNVWLAKDPAHAQAWEQLNRRLGGSFKTLRALDQRIPGQADEARQLLLQPTASRRDALRAITGLGLLGGGLWLGASTPLGDSLLADLSTGRGQRQNFNLADGSRLSLNANSAVDLHFTARQRLVIGAEQRRAGQRLAGRECSECAEIEFDAPIAERYAQAGYCTQCVTP